MSLNLTQQAVEAANKGFRVFALNHRSKKPMFMGWQDAATTDPGKVAQLWRTHPNANIGIATGDGLLVIDEDEEGKIDSLPETLPPTFTVKTRKGRHFYFRVPKGVKTKTATKVFDGVDVRGDGGLSVGPGSIHENGHVYEVCNDAPIAELPGWMLNHVVAPVRTSRDDAELERLRSNHSKDARAKSAQAYVDAVPGVGEGERDSKLFVMARRIVSDFLVPEELALPILLSYNERCYPPLDRYTVERKLESALNHGELTGEALEGGSEWLLGTPKDSTKAIGLSLEELMTYQFPERPVILSRGDSPVFRAGHIGEVYAMRGCGKTWFVHTLALVAAYGLSALGFHSPKPCKVLLVDGEMASEEIQERLGTLRKSLSVGDECPGALTTVAADWQEDFLPRIDTPEGQAFIEPYVEDADLIIFDNRSCLFDPQGETDPSSWQPAQDYLLSLRRRGKAVLLVHHSNRNGGARGLSKAEDVVNILIKLSRPEDYSEVEGARFKAEFDKHRGFHGKAALPFEATLVDGKWDYRSHAPKNPGLERKRTIRDLLLAAEAANVPYTSANKVYADAKGDKKAFLSVWGELQRQKAVQQTNGGWVWRATPGFLEEGDQMVSLPVIG